MYCTQYFSSVLKEPPSQAIYTYNTERINICCCEKFSYRFKKKKFKKKYSKMDCGFTGKSLILT